MRTILVAILSASGLLAADWPQYLGPNRDGISTETGLARTWGADGPKVLWKKPVGSGWRRSGRREYPGHPFSSGRK